jgi:hypothetical protein
MPEPQSHVQLAACRDVSLSICRQWILLFEYPHGVGRDRRILQRPKLLDVYVIRHNPLVNPRIIATIHEAHYSILHAGAVRNQST